MLHFNFGGAGFPFVITYLRNAEQIGHLSLRKRIISAVPDQDLRNNHGVGLKRECFEPGRGGGV